MEYSATEQCVDDSVVPQPDAVFVAPIKTSRKKRSKNSVYEKPTPEKIAFGQRMMRAREIAGYSQHEAAAMLGYVQGVQLSLMESGHRLPPLNVVITAARLYETTTDYLCGIVDHCERDPAAAMMRHMREQLAADVDAIAREVIQHSAQVARELVPHEGAGARLAGLMAEVNSGLALLVARNPEFEDLRGGATLMAKVELGSKAASTYAGQVEQARSRLTGLLP